MAKKYHPEEYWTEVGERIASRNDENVIAGDDEPYYRYKRKNFLKMLRSVDFNGKSVLEIGCGPGGNLIEVIVQKPASLAGADISQQMVELARKNVPRESGIEIIKINGTSLPFDDRSFDIVFTATVLQHNTDEEMLKKIMAEISRVSAGEVYLFERIENTVKGDDLCLGRPVKYYSGIMQESGFVLASKEFINIRTSYFVCGAIRKGLNPKDRQEGEPLSRLSTFLQRITLPVTGVFDKLIRSDKDIAKLHYVRDQRSDQ